MMKWKVVRNHTRSQSADRSLECLKKIEHNNNNNDEGCQNDEGKENKAPAKEANRQRASSLVRKTAVLTTECINLRSILGLARQRSETNLSSVGLGVSPPPEQPARRSRSEVRLTVDHQTTRSSSPPPPTRGGWLRGRKRERESRKSEDVPSGKTVVTGSQRKKRTAGPKQECRTDSSRKSSAGPRKSKSRRKEEDIIIEEEDVYVEIGRKEESPHPRKAGRKKGQAPRPTDPPAARDSPARRRPPRKTNQGHCSRPEVGGATVGNFATTTTTTVVAAEVHEELLYLSMDQRPSDYESLQEPPKDPDLPPFHIDTPDYSTLESTTPETSPPSDRLDLIDQYRRHKAEEDSESSDVLEGNKATEEEASVVRGSSGEESPTPFVVKKSFVLTVAKQEKGFQSLCANKRPEPPPAPPPSDHISVTFRCSADCPDEGVRQQQKRSESVPPATNNKNPPEVLPAAIRGRSRDRKSKERGKKSKGKKKESGFVMPQAVIDELSQVLEKRKPSLDEMPSFLHPPPPAS